LTYYWESDKTPPQLEQEASSPMPITRSLDSAAAVLRTTVTGQISFHDVKRHLGAVRDLNAFRYPELIDARGVDRAMLSPRELLALALDVHDALGDTPTARRAVVVDSDANFGVARVFSSLVAGRIRLGVFDDPAAAEEWLR